MTEWVQTQPRLLMLVSTVTNTVDPRNWALTVGLFMLDLCINLSSIYFAWDTDVPAVSCMILGIALMCFEVPFIGFYFQYALEMRKKIHSVFRRNDSNEDGKLTRAEAESLLVELPKGTFATEFSESLELYSMDNVIWCAHQPRMFVFRMLEFSVAWLMFFASLMLIKPAEPITSLVAIQGVVSVVGLMLVMSDFFDNYFRKYRAREVIVKYACTFAYALTLLAIFGVLLAGYGIVSLIYANRLNWKVVYVNTTAVPQDDLVGFITGWVLSAFVIIAFLFLALLNFCFTQGGCLEVQISHVGEDDPVKLLGKKRPSIFRTSNKPAQVPPNSTSPASTQSLPLPPKAVRPPPTSEDENKIGAHPSSVVLV